MIYWALLLHAYQPPTQLPGMVRKIANESYRPLITLYREMPEAKVTWNICGSLTDILYDFGFTDILEGLEDLARNGQVEFTGSAKYHPILPLIPEGEIRRQIELNIKTNQNFFGDAFKPRGFFLPELAYGRGIVKPIAETGHEWFIMSGIGCPAEWPVHIIYQVEAEGKRIAVFFRDDRLSNLVGFQKMEGGKPFLDELRKVQSERGLEDIYVITAMDAETFGHHIWLWEKLFLMDTYEELQQQKLLSVQQKQILEVEEEIRAVTVSELLDLFPKGEVVEPKPSSWSTSAEDLAIDDPYPLWKGKDNKLHSYLWESLQICLETVQKALEVADNDESRKYARIARLLLDRAEHSCQWWWASKRPWWDLNMIANGLHEHYRAMINAYKAIKSSGCAEEIKERYYHKVLAARKFRWKVSDELFM